VRRFAVLLAMLAVVAAGLAARTTTARAIVNGTTALTNPGVVSLWSTEVNRNRCGATLITDRDILTAAHCLDVLPPGITEVRFGLNNIQPTLTRHYVTAHVHPDYTGAPLYYNDVAVLRLDSPVPATIQKPAKIGAGSPRPGTQGRAAGWGWPCETPGVPGCQTSVKGPLQQANLVILPDSSCVTATLPATQLCLGPTGTVHAQACNGDSGAGFFTKVLDDYEVRGIIQQDGDDPEGNSCADAPDGSPGLGLDLDVAYYRDFIVWATNH
jgi:secreted trypsin-like serine protease